MYRNVYFYSIIVIYLRAHITDVISARVLSKIMLRVTDSDQELFVVEISWISLGISIFVSATRCTDANWSMAEEAIS